MNPMKILLVDDSKSARYALRLQLQRHGITVETADAAESALERVRDTPPDAIFMDHTMPGMNGFEALDILKTTPTTKHIPVVMCTSNEDPDFIAQAKKKGALDILSKSTAPEKLALLLDQLKQATALPEELPTQPAAGAVPSPRAGEARTADLNAGELEERVHTLIEPVMDDFAERLTKDLLTQIDERIEAQVRTSIGPPLEDLAKRLAEDLAAKTNEKLVTGLEREAEVLKQHFIKVQNEQAQLTTNRLANEILPSALQQKFEQEKQTLAQTVQELIDTSLGSMIQEASFIRRILDAAETMITDNAQQIAKAKATEVAETVAAERADAVAERMAQSGKRSNGPIYLLSAAAALVGVGAAATVFFLLG